MHTRILETPEEMGRAAAKLAAEKINAVINAKGKANIILATGASQFETLKHLVQEDIDWSKVTMFHLDEYIGMSVDHPASFRKYLQERFVDKVQNLGAAHFVHGDAPDPQQECDRLNALIAAHPIDVALVGIGENGHLAFNDPPADFEIDDPFIVVQLDQKCRRQQMGEGWFKTLDDVPEQAISMSIKQIMKSDCLIVSVPDERKAEAIKGAIEGDVSNLCPSSILQEHNDCHIFMDKAAAKLLG